jgi:GNAT superfamily N-acetyltransferase
MISYSECKDIAPEALEALFTSVSWESARFPERVAEAMQASDFVATAWKGGELVGLVSVISDKHMSAYVPYAAVRSDLQGQGIGKALMDMVTTYYHGLPRIALIAVDEAVEFYEKCGYALGQAKKPMFITSLGL